jgi:hypothetical protein
MGTGIYTYAYSNLPRDNIQKFLDEVARAFVTSDLYKRETEQGYKDTSAATLIIPQGDTDCSVTMVVNREIVVKALNQLGFNEIWDKTLDDRGLVLDA